MKSNRTVKLLALLMCGIMMMAALSGCVMVSESYNFQEDGSILYTTETFYSRNLIENVANTTPEIWFDTDDIKEVEYNGHSYCADYADIQGADFMSAEDLSQNKDKVNALKSVATGVENGARYVEMTFEIPSYGDVLDQSEVSLDESKIDLNEIVFAAELGFPQGYRTSPGEYYDTKTGTFYFPAKADPYEVTVSGWLDVPKDVPVMVEMKRAASLEILLPVPEADQLCKTYNASCTVTMVDGSYWFGNVDPETGAWNLHVGADKTSWMSGNLLPVEEEEVFCAGEYYLYEGTISFPKNLDLTGLKSYTVNGVKKDLAYAIAGDLYFNMAFGPVPGHTNPFTDVPKGAYFEDAVIWAFYHNPQITDGMSPTSFGPEKTCTRGQVVTFLWRAAGCPEPKNTKNPFTDVKATDYFYKPVLWAVEKEITDGTTPTTFSPANPCTYGHILTFIHRAMGCPATINPNEGFDGPQSVRDDVGMHIMGAENAAEQFPEWTRDAFVWAEVNNVLSGTYSGGFAKFPIKEPCPRKNVVYYLWKIDKMM